jgi:hypothetical protein
MGSTTNLQRKRVAIRKQLNPTHCSKSKFVRFASERIFESRCGSVGLHVQTGDLIPQDYWDELFENAIKALDHIPADSLQ